MYSVDRELKCRSSTTRGEYLSYKHEYNKTMAETDKILNCVDLNAIDDEGPELNAHLSTCADLLNVSLDNGVARCCEQCDSIATKGRSNKKLHKW
jgi:hypothetical protein